MQNDVLVGLIGLLASLLMLGGCVSVVEDMSVQQVNEAVTAVAPLPPPPTLIWTPTLAPLKTPIPSSAVPSSTMTPSATMTFSEPVVPTHTPHSLPVPPVEPPGGEAVTFVVIGDFGGSGAGTHEVASMVDGWQPDFIITVGDNNYPNGAAETIAENITQHYGRYIEENRFFPTLGNHDYYTANAAPYLDYFDLPGNERYYDFVRGDAHFFAINSDWNEPDGIGVNSTQAQWLQEGLAASTAPWQIVYFHVAPYSSRTESEVAVLRWPFAAWGADIVLTGHAHVYERLAVDGIPYVVNGLGGHSIYNFDENPQPLSQVRYNRNFGAMLGTVSQTQLTLQFISRAGEVIDEFALTQP